MVTLRRYYVKLRAGTKLFDNIVRLVLGMMSILNVHLFKLEAVQVVTDSDFGLQMHSTSKISPFHIFQKYVLVACLYLLMPNNYGNLNFI